MPSTNPAASGVVPGQRPAPPRPGPRPGPPRPAAPATRPGPATRRSEPAVQLVPSSSQEAVERADETVDGLLEAGRRPGDILVLTVGESHPWQQHELSFGEDAYWAQLAEGDDVFYADAAATRPLRREVVVLVVNVGGANRARQAATKAAAMAGDLLVVCGGNDSVGPLFPNARRPVPA